MDDGTRNARHLLAVSLRSTLQRKRALRLADLRAQRNSAGGDGGGGSVDAAVDCRRVTRKRFDCAELEILYGDSTESGTDQEIKCLGVISVRLRGDGARAYSVDDPRGCRRLNRGPR